jgi:predicted O-methyltransferase YrrM
MDFIPKEISDYSEKYTSLENSLLKKVNRETWQKVYMPRMISGHIQGRILSMFSKMIQPDTILEIGTYTGYSALCLAEGLSQNGRLITIDKNEELEDLVMKYFRSSDFHDKIDFRIGEAFDVIKDLMETFDLVFIDADKTSYMDYYELLLPKVRQGGIIIADNVLWSGKVPKKLKKVDRETESLRAFNKMVQEDPNVENVLIPVRDGLMVIRKI